MYLNSVLDIFYLICYYLDHNSLLALGSTNQEIKRIIKNRYPKLHEIKRTISLSTQCINCFKDLLFKPKYIQYIQTYCSKECFHAYQKIRWQSLAIKMKYKQFWRNNDFFDRCVDKMCPPNCRGLGFYCRPRESWEESLHVGILKDSE